MAGVRSGIAAQIFEKNGYTNVANYTGGWYDWEKGQFYLAQ